MNDSRKDDRLNVALVMRYREPTMLEPREGQCQNVSLSGMCILTPRPSPRGALIRFDCVSGGAADRIRGTARVVWQRSKTDPRGPAAMGVRFVRLEPGCREALEGLVEQLGGDRQAGVERSAAPSSSNPPRDPAANRIGAATVIISPVSASGVTQQGMGAVRSRKVQYPTLRGMGIPSTAPPGPSNGSSSHPPTGDVSAAEGATDARDRSSPRPAPLDVTLPGHATTTPSPFSATPSAPPDPPAGDASGALRDGLDRTRRGMPPFSTPPEHDEPSGEPYTDRAARIRSGSSDRSPRERNSERAPRSGGVDDLGASSLPPRPDESVGRGDHAATATAEPVDDETAARRRAARAAAVSFATPALADPDSARKKNWLPWVVIGSGLLASWLMIRIFGSVPAGVPVGVNPDVSDGDQGKSAPSEPAVSASATPPLAPAAPATPGTLPTGTYVLEVTSEPVGARISAADQVVLAPAVIELATLSGPIAVKAELEGHETTTMTVNPVDFQLKDGRQVSSLVVKLPAASTSGVASAPDVQKAAGGDKRAPAEQRTSSSARQATAKTDEAKASSSRRSRSSSRVTKPPAVESATPVITQPPVPMGPAASSAEAPAATSPAPTPGHHQPTAASGPSALDAALECLSRGDNLCVISTLEGRAKTARELEVLIETHLALGNAVDAERGMQRYLERFPDSKSAAKYQRWLERRSEPGATP